MNCEDQAGGKTHKGLSSAVIYEPNASGKTNVIGAMDTFRSIILRGRIRNADTAYQSGLLEGTTPMFEAYMRLKKSMAAALIKEAA